MPYRGENLLVNGVSTFLLRGGRGAPLLVLAPQLSPSRWFPYHEALAARFRVLAPDHPGCGRSDPLPWLDGIDDLVFHYTDLLDQLGLERVRVLGTSLGGWIAAELAATHPGRVERLVLIGAAGLRVEGAERFDLFLHSIEETWARLFHDPSRIPQLLPSQMDIEAIASAYRERTTLARVAWNPYLYNPKLGRRLYRIQAPTLILWGGEDRFLSVAHGEEYARAIAGSELRVIPQCGHLAPYEKADEVTKWILPFLSGEGE